MNKIFAYLNGKAYLKFYGNKCYYSATGLKKNYPSYPSKLEIYLTENEIIFIGKNDFPFIFKTLENPFILSKNPNKLKENLSFERIFKPTKINTTDKTLSFSFVDNITQETNIDYQINLEINKDYDSLKKISDWC